MQLSGRTLVLANDFTNSVGSGYHVIMLYQRLERVFHPISKHLEVGLKNSATTRFFQTTSQCLEFG